MLCLVLSHFILNAATPSWKLVYTTGDTTLILLESSRSCGRSYIGKISCFPLAFPTNTECALLCSFDHLAAESNTVIVPCVGMIVVPSDIMAYVANKTLKSFAGPLTGIDMSTSAWEINGFTYSGGSIASALSAIENPSKEAKNAVRTDFSLSPGNFYCQMECRQ